MPPQNNSQMPNQQQQGPGPSVNPLQNNQKLVPTIKIFAIYGSILYVVNSLTGMIVSSFRFSAYYYGSGFTAAALIGAIVYGIIAAVIGGAIFSFIYEPIKNWVKRNAFLSKYIHDMFTLFWKPYLVVFVIMQIMSLLAVLALPVFFMGWLISAVINIAVYYWYSKTISSKLSELYPW